MKLLLLHLSDIHVDTRSDSFLAHADSIVSAANPRINSAEVVFVVVSGDVAFSGRREQYEIASGFFEQLRSGLSKQTDSPIHFIITPGNHDCDFTGDQSVRDALIGTILQKGEDSITPEIVAACTRVQSEFFSFRDTWGPADVAHKDELWVTYSFDIGGYKVLFDVINVAWMSRLHEEQGKLVFPVKRYEKLTGESSAIRIAVMHHPLNWYNQATYRPFRRLVRTLARIIITGHEHEQNVGENIDTETEHSTYVEGGVLYARDGKSQSSFNIVEIDMSEGMYASELHVWNGSMYVPREMAAWQNYRTLPPTTNNALVFRREFAKQMDDPGGAFSHPGKQNVTLSDIYIYPDLRVEHRRDKTVKETVSAGSLRDINLIYQGVVLKGDEKTGKTSLIYQLIRHFHENGCAPVLLNGAELKPNERELSKRVASAVQRQYGDDAWLNWQQLPHNKKIVFVDDFDAQKLTNGQREAILSVIKSSFGGIFLSVSDLFEMDEVVLDGPVKSLVGFNEYELLEFGHKLRFELIRKWTLLGEGVGRDSTDVFAALDRAEKSITAIVGRNLVPRVPIYLLTLLQSLEAGQQSDLQNSAYGDCYRFLITGAFAQAGVKAIEMQEYLQFCTLLSWEYCRKQLRELEESAVARFNDWFSTQYYRRDFRHRIDILVECKA